ncbi:protein DpdH [Paraburkholderia sp. J7]|uniref:protein DpdH n=1 Tax=Paraburkholderia sp. J7 TaxID=2805438 RepID=UPI002AB5ED98|nr:protein DpdH [Paraburkholderia sp. J7]
MNAMTPCWSPDQVLRVVTSDAEEISDHVFNAVHCRTDLQMADTWNGQRYPVQTEDLVEKFLEPGRRYVQAVVLGESGTGKSHLIQWLRLNLPKRSEDLVLTIPKVGTSLRGIVERIVERLPVESRAPFEEKLRAASSQTTTHEARVDKFLFSLAWSVKHAIAVQSSEEMDLADMLPDVLSDPSFRRGFFSAAGGTVDQIVRHIFDNPEGRDDQAARRQFQIGDLPLSGEHYGNAALQARDAIDFIRGEAGMEQRAIDLMTRALEPAIAQTLNFTADDLIELMRNLRIHLAQRGQRLILLIEDFARLQGIDTALLQALVTPPRQEEEQLCELRWAMAVTTGYFRSRFDETVRTRATFVVDMDRSQPPSVPQFAVGYLNAIRVGEAALLATPLGAPIPNRCDDCAVRTSCWEAFGQEGGTGLFPFNARALNSLADRVGARQEAGFNPRVFLKAVIEPVMMQHHAEIINGLFPSAALLRRVGGENRLRAQTIADLERRDAAWVERRVALLEIWDGTGQLVNLHPGIHQAFGLPALANTADSPPESTNRGESTQGVTPTSRPESPLISAIQQWAVQPDSILSQSHVQSLRGLIYSALDGFIDWDELGVQKALATTAFRLASINFDRQQTARTRTAISLELPLRTRTIAQTAVALEALVRVVTSPDTGTGEVMLDIASLLSELQLWANEITAQIKRVFRGDAQWDPTVGAVEVLTLTLMQSGRIKVGDSTEAIVGKLFERTAPPTMTALTSTFRQHNERLSQQYEPVRALLKALCSGSKGGRIGNFTRIQPILQAVRALRRRNLQLTQIPPTEYGIQDLRPLGELYGRLLAGYSTAFEDERKAWSEWLVRVRLALGDNSRRPSSLVALVEQLLTEAENAGLDLGAMRESMRTQLMSLPSPRTMDQAMDHWIALELAQGAEALIRCALASGQRVQLDQVINGIEAILSRIESRVKGELQQIEVDVGEGLNLSKKTIGESLAICVTAIDRFGIEEETK